MYKRMIMAFVFVSSLVTQAQAVTIDEIRKTLEDDRQSIKTIHIIGFVEKLDSNLSILDKATTEENYKRLKTFQSVVTENDTIIDCRSPRKAKLVQEDVRDLNEYFKSEKIPLNTVKYIAQNKIILAKEGYRIYMANQTGTALRIYKEDTSEGNFQVPSTFQTPYFGIPNAGYFTKDQNFVITECPPLICVDIRYSGKPWILRFELDPALGCRLRTFKWFNNNICKLEIIADDYRDVNGIPYPFVYKTKTFNQSGETSSEENFYAEKVTFNEEFKDEDFRMFVAPETEVSIPGELIAPDTRSFRIQKIKGGCYLGVDDILQMTAESLQEK